MNGGGVMLNNRMQAVSRLFGAAIALFWTVAVYADDANPLATIKRSNGEPRVAEKRHPATSTGRLSRAELTLNKSASAYTATLRSH